METGQTPGLYPLVDQSTALYRAFLNGHLSVIISYASMLTLPLWAESPLNVSYIVIQFMGRTTFLEAQVRLASSLYHSWISTRNISTCLSEPYRPTAKSFHRGHDCLLETTWFTPRKHEHQTNLLNQLQRDPSGSPGDHRGSRIQVNQPESNKRLECFIIQN